MSEDDSISENDVREAVDRSRSGAPAAGKAIRDRFSSDEIFQRVVAAADEEITAGTRELFFSGLAAGFAITLTFFLHAAVTAATGDETGLVGGLLYPLGFIYIILGGYQLYTENTLPPVALVLERIASVPSLLRIWGIVLLANVLGAAVGAFVLANTGVLSPEGIAVATSFGTEGLETDWWDLFFKAIFAGLIVAGVVWLDYAARDTVSRFLLVYLAFLTIPTGGLYHVVVSVCDMFFLVFRGELALVTGLWEFFLPVFLGNTLGGVVLVTLVNYGQTSQRRFETGPDVDEASQPQLSAREWLLGDFAGRSYVPPSGEREARQR
nr:formate/nitrite transporter family protein [Halegenticoccus tardaugens]